MNKYYIGLGAAIAMATPIIATVSCGSKNKKEEVKQPAKVEEIKNVNVNPQQKIETEVKSVSDTKWTEEQQKAEEAANEKATADAEKAFADKKAELEKTATDESKANLEKAMFNHMETLEENIADIQKLYEAQKQSLTPEQQFVEKRRELLRSGVSPDVADKLHYYEFDEKLTLEANIAALQKIVDDAKTPVVTTVDSTNSGTVFSTSKDAWNKLFEIIKQKSPDVQYEPTRAGGTIYHGIANLFGGYHDEKLNVYKTALSTYFDQSATEESKIAAIEAAIKLLG